MPRIKIYEKNYFMSQRLFKILPVLFFIPWMLIVSCPVLAKKNGAETLATPEKAIKVEHSREQDIAIRNRLKEIFSELDGFNSLSVSVSNGIVTLTGKIASKQSEDKALELAEQLEGVVEVDNQLSVSQSVIERSQFILDKFTNLGKRSLESLPLFLLAVAVFWLFWVIWHNASKRFVPVVLHKYLSICTEFVSGLWKS